MIHAVSKWTALGMCAVALLPQASFASTFTTGATGESQRAGASSPQQLYRALLASPLTTLPAGFHSPKARSRVPGTIPKRHHAVGWVAIELNRGRAGIDYVVFPTRADVVGDFGDALSTYKDEKTVRRQACAADLPKPCVTLSGSVSGTDFTTMVSLRRTWGSLPIRRRVTTSPPRSDSPAVRFDTSGWSSAAEPRPPLYTPQSRSDCRSSLSSAILGGSHSPVTGRER